MKELFDPRINILGNSSIGIFGFSTNLYSIMPGGIKQKTYDSILGILKNKIISTSLSDTHLNGLFCTGNNNHLLLPSIISDAEYNLIEDQLSEIDVTIGILSSKITALGNSIVTSNKRALVHNDFSSKDKSKISEILDVEVESRTFLNSPLIGSMIILNDNGFLTHPLFSEEDIEWLESYFGVHGDVVTVNRGLPYPRLGIIANDKGVLVGSDTTGPEILRITEVFS